MSWYEKKNEKRIGVPLSRVPEWFNGLANSREEIRVSNQWHNLPNDIKCRLEEIVIAYDQNCCECENLKKRLREIHEGLDIETME